MFIGINMYQEKLKILTKIINEADPVNLLALNYPQDEYSSEIMSILSLTERNRKEDLIQEIYDIFQKSFGPQTFIDINKIKTIAEEIRKAKSLNHG